MEVLKKIFLTLLTLASLLFITKNVHAESNQLFFTGSTLYNFCRDNNIAHQSACEGYILSVNDNMFSKEYKNEYKICYPKGVSPAQLRLQLVKFQSHQYLRQVHFHLRLCRTIRNIDH